MDALLVNEEMVTKQLHVSSEVRGAVRWHLGVYRRHLVKEHA